jgi:hypothetical protein
MMAAGKKTARGMFTDASYKLSTMTSVSFLAIIAGSRSLYPTRGDDLATGLHLTSLFVSSPRYFDISAHVLRRGT